jgi:large-conductance mechanosensitive channel
MLASLLTSCQRRELVGNLSNMQQTKESRPETVIKQGNAIDTIWKVGLTAAVVFLLYKNHKAKRKMYYLYKENKRLQDAFNNFMDDNFEFQPIDADDLNGVHVYIQPNQNPLLQAMDNVE